MTSKDRKEGIREDMNQVNRKRVRPTGTRLTGCKGERNTNERTRRRNRGEKGRRDNNNRVKRQRVRSIGGEDVRETETLGRAQEERGQVIDKRGETGRQVMEAGRGERGYKRWGGEQLCQALRLPLCSGATASKTLIIVFEHISAPRRHMCREGSKDRRMDEALESWRGRGRETRKGRKRERERKGRNDGVKNGVMIALFREINIDRKSDGRREERGDKKRRKCRV